MRYVEAIYRNYTPSCSLPLNIFSEDYPYHSCYLIAISNEAFRCVKVSEFRNFERKEDLLKDTYLLSENNEFNLDMGLIELFESNAKGIYNAISKLK